jgi:uncharacterized protein with GYD domain
MATFISLLHFTDQGIRNVRETTKRARAFQEAAAKMGIKVRDLFWTLGKYDLVSIVDAPDAETAEAFLLASGSLGNVRIQTMQAFSVDQMEKILAKTPKV